MVLLWGGGVDRRECLWHYLGGGGETFMMLPQGGRERRKCLWYCLFCSLSLFTPATQAIKINVQVKQKTSIEWEKNRVSVKRSANQIACVAGVNGPHFAAPSPF